MQTWDARPVGRSTLHHTAHPLRTTTHHGQLHSSASARRRPGEMTACSLTFRSIHYGCADATLRVGDTRVDLTASYLADAPADLLRGTLQVCHPGPAARVSWWEEPGEYRWLLDPVGDDLLRVRILWFTELWSDAPDDASERTVIDQTCSRHDFTQAVTEAAELLLAQMGLAGYADAWMLYPFPLRDLHQLQRALGRPLSDPQTHP